MITERIMVCAKYTTVYHMYYALHVLCSYTYMYMYMYVPMQTTVHVFYTSTILDIYDGRLYTGCPHQNINST